jgi:hypothetical protein
MNTPQGVTKTILRPGNGRDSPHTGDTVVIDYTGYLYDETRGENEYFMGTQCVPANSKRLAHLPSIPSPSMNLGIPRLEGSVNS